MDFSVELSHQAQADVAGIYDWLRSQEAGDAGERWFIALRTANQLTEESSHSVPNWLLRIEEAAGRQPLDVVGGESL